MSDKKCGVNNEVGGKWGGFTFPPLITLCYGGYLVSGTPEEVETEIKEITERIKTGEIHD